MRIIAKLTLAAILAACLTTDPAISKETGYVFVSSEKDHVVTVLDGTSYELIKNIETSERPRHLQLTTD